MNRDDKQQCKDVVVTGLSPLIVAGLRQILIGFCEVSCIDDARESKEADCWIVSPSSLLSALDFFMLRKDKTLILSDARVNGSGFRCVGSDAGCAEIVEEVRMVIERSTRVDEPESRQLSERETDVLRCLAAGMTVKEIANKLCISSNTVTTHRKNISSKLGIRSISGLSLYALMNGIV